MSGLFVGHELVRDYGGPSRGERVELPLQALSTHAFVCGATGTGKTVFAKAIVEEVAMAGIPVIAIDLKGDLASLAINGDVLASRDLDAVFGAATGGLRAAYAEGLATSPSLRERQQRFAETVDVRLFTPRSAGARPLAMTGLPTFSGHAVDHLERQDRRTLVETLARGLSARAGARQQNGRRADAERKFVEELVWALVEQGVPLGGREGIERLIQAVANPPFEELGTLPLDDFLRPAWRRDLQAALAARVTGNESAWYEGERLDVETLIGGGDGRTPIAVLYLGHLPGFEDQANVIAQTCSEIYRWMRRAGGSPELRALLYIDEVGGGEGRNAFYPSAPYDPSSKAPLTLLVKQGRSNGVGVLLATQNPMSVDVRGLGNVGTWAVGRLQQNNDLGRIQHLFDASPYRKQRLREDIGRAGPGEFLLQRPGTPEPRWVRERWLCTMHQTLSPDQLHALYRLKSGLPVPEPGQRLPVPSEPPAHAPPAAPPVPAEVAPQLGARAPAAPTRVIPPTLPTETREVSPKPAAWTAWVEGRAVELLIGARYVIGRDATAALRLTGDTVSRQHAEIAVEVDGALTIRHLSQKNATRVAGTRITDARRVELAESPVELLLGEERVTVERR